MSLGLPRGIRSRSVNNVNGLAMHVLEAGFEAPDRGCVLLLHGFPELAYSWRKVMLPLARAGFHVVAPDQRGYGRTTGWDGRYDGDLASFRIPNLARDTQALLAALGYRSVAAVAGHDFGSSVAGYCALLDPGTFRSVALMSAPFGGPPSPEAVTAPLAQLDAALAALPRPRKHYQAYYLTRAADPDMRFCAQGLHAFLRAYYHCKSADWKGNEPRRLSALSAVELATLPSYYIMDLDKNMPQTVAPYLPAKAAAWLTDSELAVYAAEFARTGFQGGLQWYRCAREERFIDELRELAGRTIDVPACFIAGRRDWGVYQRPDDFERMQNMVCTRFDGAHLIEGAGHWVQQEQSEKVAELLLDFLRR